MAHCLQYCYQLYHDMQRIYLPTKHFMLGTSNCTLDEGWMVLGRGEDLPKWLRKDG